MNEESNKIEVTFDLETSVTKGGSYHKYNVRAISEQAMDFINADSNIGFLSNEKRTKVCEEYMRMFAVDYWARTIPELRFHHAYHVRMFPPIGSALVRFCITKPREVSVYLDGYCMLGMINVNKNAIKDAYWEVWFVESGTTERFNFNNHEKMMASIHDYCFDSELHKLLLNNK